MDEIRHKGKIIEITPEFTSVEIISESACGACHAKAMCAMAETEAKIIQLPTSGWTERKVGDEVVVALKASMGHKAVWLAYVVPLIVLVAGLFGGLRIFDELGAGLFSIALVALYYLILYCFRKKLNNEYIFYLI